MNTPPKPSARFFALFLLLSATALIVVAIICSFNPGCTNSDTLDMWGQAHAGKFHDWHPIALSIIMSYLIRIHDGFQPVIALQVIFFAIGVWLTVRRNVSPVLGIVLLLAGCFFPPVFFWLGVMCKDSFMASLLVLATGAIYEYAESRRAAFLWLGLASLYLGFAVRQNGVFAVMPLVLWPLLLRLSWRRALAVWVTVPIVFIGLNVLVSAAYRAPHEHPEQCAIMYDLAALSVEHGVLLVPEEFRQSNTTLDNIQKALDPYNNGWLFWGPRSVFKLSSNPAQLKDLVHVWVASIIKYPGSYLAWRTEVFTAYLGLANLELEPYISSCIVPNENGYAPVESRLHFWVMDRLHAMEDSVVFKPYPYLALLGVFLVVALIRRHWDTIFVVAAGLCYSAAYFIIAPASNFRYATFSVFIAVLLVLRFASQLIEKLAGRRRSADRSGSVAPAVILSILLLAAVFPIVKLARPTDAVLAQGAVFVNTDFESGQMSPWQSFQQVHASISDEHAHGGKFSLAEADGVGSVYQDVSGLRPNGWYRLSAWVFASPDATSHPQVAVWDSVANVAKFSNPVDPWPTWQEITEDVQASSRGTLRVHLFRQDGVGTLYWDDIHLYRE